MAHVLECKGHSFRVTVGGESDGCTKEGGRAGSRR